MYKGHKWNKRKILFAFAIVFVCNFVLFLQMKSRYASSIAAKEKEIQALQSAVKQAQGLIKIYDESTNSLKAENEELMEEATRQQHVTTEPKRPDRPSPDKKRWLIIGIPSFPRPHDEDYLIRTLDALASQLSDEPADPFYDQVKVVVMNNRPSDHRIFEEARRKFSNGHPKSSFFVFTENPGRHADAGAAFNPGSANVPGTRVQQQTRNVASLLEEVAGQSKYFLFMEDDFELCPNGLKAIHYMIEKATLYANDWGAIRCGFGLNGVIVRGDDVAEIARYFLQHVQRRPPDHLMVEWFARETEQSRTYLGNRPNFAFRYNVLDHLGVVSTLRETSHQALPRCFHELLFPVNFEVEAFSPQECPEDDLWPCNFSGVSRPPRIHFA